MTRTYLSFHSHARGPGLGVQRVGQRVQPEGGVEELGVLPPAQVDRPRDHSLAPVGLISRGLGPEDAQHRLAIETLPRQTRELGLAEPSAAPLEVSLELFLKLHALLSKTGPYCGQPPHRVKAELLQPGEELRPRPEASDGPQTADEPEEEKSPQGIP